MNSNSNSGKRKKILLHGAFFGSNYGDVLFSDVFSNEISKNGHPILGKIGNYVKERNKINFHMNELINFFKSDAVVFAPGGYFGEPSKTGLSLLYWRIRMLTTHAYLGLICNILKKPYSIIGIGVGPINFKLGKIVVKKIFEGASIATVRDDESMKYLSDMGVKNSNISVTVDSIVCLKDKLLTKDGLEFAHNIIPREKKIILLHITSGGEKGMEVAKAVKSFLDKNVGYQVIICTDFLLKGKNEYIENIKNIFNLDDYILFDYTPERLSAVISLSDLIITTKLHVGIVGASLGRSVLSFPVHNKTVRFYNQISTPERCIPLNEITKEKVEDLINTYKGQKIVIDEKLMIKSNENYTVLQSFISKL